MAGMTWRWVRENVLALGVVFAGGALSASKAARRLVAPSRVPGRYGLDAADFRETGVHVHAHRRFASAGVWGFRRVHLVTY